MCFNELAYNLKIGYAYTRRCFIRVVSAFKLFFCHFMNKGVYTNVQQICI